MKKEDRINVYNKYRGRCAYCGEEIAIKDMQVDHIIPQINYENSIRNNFMIPDFLKHLAATDVNHIDNLNPACRVCNLWKSAHSLQRFREELQEQVKRLNNYSSNYRMAKRYGQIKETVEPIVFYFERIKAMQPCTTN